MRARVENNDIVMYVELPKKYMIGNVPHNLRKLPIEVAEREGFHLVVYPTKNEYQEYINLELSDLVDNQWIFRVRDFSQQEIDDYDNEQADMSAKIKRGNIENLSNDVRINAEIMIDGIDSPSQAKEQFWAQIETVFLALSLGRPEMALPRMEGISRGNAPFSDVYDYLLSEITKLQEI